VNAPFVTRRFYEQFHVVLLDDALLFTKRLEVREGDRAQLRVVDLSLLETIVHVDDVSKSVFSLSLIGEADKFVITARDPLEKDRWSSTLTKQLKGLASLDGKVGRSPRRKISGRKLKSVDVEELDDEDGLF
jgi:hypothetical protein